MFVRNSKILFSVFFFVTNVHLKMFIALCQFPICYSQQSIENEMLSFVFVFFFRVIKQIIHIEHIIFIDYNHIVDGNVQIHSIKSIENLSIHYTAYKNNVFLFYRISKFLFQSHLSLATHQSFFSLWFFMRTNWNRIPITILNRCFRYRK